MTKYICDLCQTPCVFFYDVGRPFGCLYGNETSDWKEYKKTDKERVNRIFSDVTKEKDERPAATPEPTPTGNGSFVLFEVLKDICARSDVGQKKYGTMLRTDNGRDALNDFMQEQYDGIMYFKQFSIERENETEILCQVYALLVDLKHQGMVTIAQSAGLLSQILKKRNVNGVDLNLHQNLV